MTFYRNGDRVRSGSRAAAVVATYRNPYKGPLLLVTCEGKADVWRAEAVTPVSLVRVYPVEEA